MNAIGVNFISPQGDWEGEMVPLFARMKPTLAKVQIPAGFSTAPSHVEQLIGAMPGPERTVILRTEDCKPFAAEVRHELVDRGFLQLIDARPDVRFILEIGNEPEYCGLPLDEYLAGQAATIHELKPELDRHNLLWMPSLPLGQDRVEQAMASYVGQPWDCVGVHLYGHFQLGDEGVMGPAYDWLVANSPLPVYVTEMGINDTGVTSDAEKARRYVAFFDSLPDIVHGCAIWTISQDGRFDSYQLTAEMADIIARRKGAPKPIDAWWFHVTNQTVSGEFLTYWRQAGLDLGDDGVSYRESVALFGYPLDAPHTEVNADGHRVMSQTFERAVFELHPANEAPYRVQLRRLGAEHLERKRRTSTS